MTRSRLLDRIHETSSAYSSNYITLSGEMTVGIGFFSDFRVLVYGLKTGTCVLSQQTFTCSKPTTQTIEKGAKYVQ